VIVADTSYEWQLNQFSINKFGADPLHCYCRAALLGILQVAANFADGAVIVGVST
jgi:hypothetical protein